MYFHGRDTDSLSWLASLHPPCLSALTSLQRELLLTNKHYGVPALPRPSYTSTLHLCAQAWIDSCGSLASDKSDVQLSQWPSSFTDSPPVAAPTPFNVLNTSGIYEWLQWHFRLGCKCFIMFIQWQKMGEKNMKGNLKVIAIITKSSEWTAIFLQFLNRARNNVYIKLVLEV